MKLHTLLLFWFFTSISSFAQLPLNSATLDLTLTCSGGTANRTGVSFNPNQQLYYSVNAGSSGYPIETFDVAGNNLSSTNAGFDYRGSWWNPNTNSLEGNGFSTSGIWIQDLNASAYPLSTGTVSLAGVSGPTTQSSANYDWIDDEILYYDNGIIYRYSRLSHTLISSVSISGLPVAFSNLNSNSIAYTGVVGMEVGVYDYINKTFYFIDKITGIYQTLCQLPLSAPASDLFKMGFANGYLWLYDSANSQWKGYRSVSECLFSEQTVSILDDTLCINNNGTTISTGSSQTSFIYYLRDNANDTIVNGPIIGSGNGLTFNTGILDSSMSYNVFLNNDFAVDLPSSDDYINFNSPYNTFANEITVESWVYAQNAGDDIWAGQSTPAIDNNITNVWLWHGNTFYVNDNSIWRQTNIPPLPQGWTHIATVANADSLAIYFNGVLVQTSGTGTGISTQIVNNSNSEIHLGHDPRFPAGTAGRNSNIAFDNFKVWNVAKTAAEIASTYTSCLTGTETNLQVLCGLNDGVGVAITSLTGSDATIINPTTGSNWIAGGNNCSSCSLELTSIVSVVVQDSLAPVADATTLLDTTATCEVASLTAPTATDNCATTVTVTNDATLPITMVGTTVVTWTYDDGNGNTSTQTQNVIVSAPTIDVTTSTLNFVITANNTTATSYQWINCADNLPIAGETNATYTAAANGNYKVAITEGICSDTSMCVQIAGVGIEELSDLGVSIFPNPNNGEFTISTTENNVAITIYSVDGKVIVNDLKITEANQFINLGDIESGIYFVKVTNDINQKTVRLVVE